MINPEYQVEFDGTNYVVLKSGQALISFDSCDSAYSAKRDFEGKVYPSGWEKIPPAMRNAKQLLYGSQI